MNPTRAIVRERNSNCMRLPSRENNSKENQHGSSVCGLHQHQLSSACDPRQKWRWRTAGWQTRQEGLQEEEQEERKVKTFKHRRPVCQVRPLLGQLGTCMEEGRSSATPGVAFIFPASDPPHRCARGRWHTLP